MGFQATNNGSSSTDKAKTLPPKTPTSSGAPGLVPAGAPTSVSLEQQRRVPKPLLGRLFRSSEKPPMHTSATPQTSAVAPDNTVHTGKNYLSELVFSCSFTMDVHDGFRIGFSHKVAFVCRFANEVLSYTNRVVVGLIVPKLP